MVETVPAILPRVLSDPLARPHCMAHGGAIPRPMPNRKPQGPRETLWDRTGGKGPQRVADGLKPSHGDIRYGLWMDGLVDFLCKQSKGLRAALWASHQCAGAHWWAGQARQPRGGLPFVHPPRPAVCDAALWPKGLQ